MSEDKLLRCVDCKFWDIEKPDINRATLSKRVEKDPTGLDGFSTVGVCLKTVVFEDDDPDDPDDRTLAFSSSLISIPRLEDDENPLGVFIDGSPFEDLLAKRLEKQFSKISKQTWLTTSAAFACNQSEAASDPCKEDCLHCEFQRAKEEKEENK